MFRSLLSRAVVAIYVPYSSFSCKLCHVFSHLCEAVWCVFICNLAAYFGPNLPNEESRSPEGSQPAYRLNISQAEHLRRRVLSGTDRVEGRALKPLPAPGAVCDLLGVGFARLQVVEKHPIVSASYPPELSPDFMLLLARTTQQDHRLISFPAQGRV